MMRNQWIVTLLVLLLGSPLVRAQAFTEGKDYFLIEPAQATHVAPGKIEVAEFFSYGCPFCAQFSPYMDQLKKSLPASAELVYIPASFNKAEDWPMFQRAVCAAQMLGIFEKTNDAMFDAVWKSGELAVSDPQTHRLKVPQPTIEDVANVYHRISGVPADKFLSTANSFAVDVKMRADDALLTLYQVDSTPTLTVAGKYRISTAGGMQKMGEIAVWLVAKESVKSGK
jgi:thiol:disulfide interchange protein DsbA